MNTFHLKTGSINFEHNLSVQTTSTPEVPIRMPSRLVTHFGEMVDVRNRDAVRIGRFAGTCSALQDTAAVVRVWTAEQCREMTSHEARAFASQLLAAAALAENQNNIVQ